MKIHFAKLPVIAGLVLLAGCTFLAGDPNPSREYAELRLNDSGKIQILIWADRWTGLIGHAGYGGLRHLHVGWFYVQGDGPVYRNPQIHPNGGQVPVVGTITIDREHKKVIVKLQAIVDGKKVNMDLINGSYAIESINHDPFYLPGLEFSEQVPIPGRILTCAP